MDAGNDPEMRTVLAPALAAATIVVFFARALAVFARRYALLAATGELDRRRDVRRAERIAVAVHAAVHVDGASRRRMEDGDDDVDDMGLLARAMNVGLITYIAEPEPPSPEFPAELFEQEEAAELPVPILATVLGFIAVAFAVPALVRPLEAWSPWLVGAAVILGIAAWFVAHRDTYHD